MALLTQLMVNYLTAIVYNTGWAKLTDEDLWLTKTLEVGDLISPVKMNAITTQADESEHNNSIYAEYFTSSCLALYGKFLKEDFWL